MTSKHRALEAMRDHYKQKRLALADYPRLKNSSKSRALEHFRAKMNKQELPINKAKKKENSEYKRMSIEEYEKKFK